MPSSAKSKLSVMVFSTMKCTMVFEVAFRFDLTFFNLQIEPRNLQTAASFLRPHG
jgi:hypothetical protein